MNPLFEGPLGPQRLEHLNIKDFPNYQRWVQDWTTAGLLAYAARPVTDERVIEGECVETPDPRTDLIHPFTD